MTTAPESSPTAEAPHQHPITAPRRAVIGALATATALGAQELVAGLTGLPSLVAGTAAWIIDIAPGDVAEWSIGNLEYWTKPTLITGIATVLVLAGIATARLRARPRRIAYVSVALIGALITSLGEPGVSASLATGAIAAAVGVLADAALRRSTSPPHNASRRVFLGAAASIAAVAIAAAVGGRALVERSIRRLSRREDVVLPDAVDTVQPVTSAHEFDIEGLDPVVTPNERFYIVDITALNPPAIDLPEWTLTVAGMVDQELTLTYDDLLAMDLVESYATLSCVSNKIGGRLVGNARWLGVPFSRILEMAGAWPTAEQVAARGADGFTTGFPLAAVYDRETILAVGMNGEPLPHEHGFPARLVVPGYYGFVSATKWMERVDLTTWDGHDAYWVKLGWAKYAPVQTQSRVDTPRDKTTFAAGPRMAAGVAWAPFLGISAVEVSFDGGPWQQAEVSEPLGDATWVQWRIPWDPAPGEHTITVRATDGDGVTQIATVAPPIPGGATGYHTVNVRAE